MTFIGHLGVGLRCLIFFPTIPQLSRRQSREAASAPASLRLLPREFLSPWSRGLSVISWHRITTFSHLSLRRSLHSLHPVVVKLRASNVHATAYLPTSLKSPIKVTFGASHLGVPGIADVSQGRKDMEKMAVVPSSLGLLSFLLAV